MPAVLHGADTTAVRAFMDKKINFTDIAVIIQKTLDAHEIIEDPDLEDILASENWAEIYAETLIP
jgi:1-deoxy-D-xylulose-5-phosphate reductoisomerase